MDETDGVVRFEFDLEVGKEYMAKCRDAIPAYACYPWGGKFVPIRIDEEYPSFYVAKVLGSGHGNFWFEEPEQYNITFDKADIITKDFFIKELDNK